MKIFQVASELHPCAKIGGLGDVVYGLSKELLSLGHKVEVIIPHYDTLATQLIQNLHFVEKGVAKGLVDTIPVTFLKPEGMDLTQIYGKTSDAKDFLLFCKAAASYIKDPDIVHLHDWPAAPLTTFFPEKSVLTLHNVYHQGICNAKLLELCHIPLPQESSANLLKIGIQHAKALCTVSPTYAKEILQAPSGCKLESYLQTKKVHGILNGIDFHYWDPSKDPYLFKSFDPDPEQASCTLQAKKENRIELQKALQMAPPHNLLLSVIGRLDPQKGLEMIRTAISTALKKGHQFLLIGSPSTKEIGKEWQRFAQEFAGNQNIHFHFTFDHKIGHQAFAASDLILVPSLFEPCGLTQLIAMRYGAIPLVRKTGGLQDTVVEDETGFTFDEATSSAINTALEKAFVCPLHKWEKMVANGLSQDHSWKKPAKAYLDVYNMLK